MKTITRRNFIAGTGCAAAVAVVVVGDFREIPGSNPALYNAKPGAAVHMGDLVKLEGGWLARPALYGEVVDGVAVDPDGDVVTLISSAEFMRGSS